MKTLKIYESKDGIFWKIDDYIVKLYESDNVNGGNLFPDVDGWCAEPDIDLGEPAILPSDARLIAETDGKRFTMFFDELGSIGRLYAGF